MDCRKGLVLALGLAGAVGCVPQNSVQPPPAAPRAVTEKAKDPPKHPPTAPTCVAGANYYATSGDEAPPRSALQEHLYDQARRGYQQAIDIDPTCVAAYKGLAHLCAQMSDHEGAVKWYRKGLEKQPKDASLWLEFGVCQARHKVEVEAPTREVYEKIFGAVAKKLGMSPCPEAVDYLYERYYSGKRCARASDCRDLLETVQSICRFRKQPVQLTRDLIAEAATSFICEFK